MSREKEFTTGGSEVRRYDVPTGDPQVVEASADARAALQAHFDRVLGPPAAVLHDTASAHVHVDVHFVAPTPARPTWAVYTLGMSDRPMSVPQGSGVPDRAEILVFLPAGWKLDEASLRDEVWYWPVRQLRVLANFPHAYDTYVSVGHTLATEEPPEAFAPGCPFSAVLVRPPVSLPADAQTVAIPGGKVRVYAMVPLTREETEHKLERGIDDLLKALRAAGVGDVVDIGRASVAPPRKRWYQIF